MSRYKTPDVQTMMLPGIPAKRGRPASGKAMSNAERQRKYRKNHNSIKSSARINATIKALAKDFDLPESVITRELLRFALCNRNWKQTGFPELQSRLTIF